MRDGSRERSEIGEVGIDMDWVEVARDFGIGFICKGSFESRVDIGCNKTVTAIG